MNFRLIIFYSVSGFNTCWLCVVSRLSLPRNSKKLSINTNLQPGAVDRYNSTAQQLANFAQEKGKSNRCETACVNEFQNCRLVNFDTFFEAKLNLLPADISFIFIVTVCSQLTFLSGGNNHSTEMSDLCKSGGECKLLNNNTRTC